MGAAHAHQGGGDALDGVELELEAVGEGQGELVEAAVSGSPPDRRRRLADVGGSTVPNLGCPVSSGGRSEGYAVNNFGDLPLARAMLLMPDELAEPVLQGDFPKRRRLREESPLGRRARARCACSGEGCHMTRGRHILIPMSTQPESVSGENLGSRLWRRGEGEVYE
jgi:hypothetical protein